MEMMMTTTTRNEKKDESSDDSHMEQQILRLYEVKVSSRFLCLSLAVTTLLAFTVGRATRMVLMEGARQAFMSPHDESSMFVRPHYHDRKTSLPPPVLLDGKTNPHTIYTSKNFDTAASTVASLLLEETTTTSDDSSSDPSQKDGVCSSSESCSRGKKRYEEEEEEEESDHLPAGQHLLVDMKNVDGEFLNSAERLAAAMIEVIEVSRLTLLSYHCHSLVPSGVSCVGVLLESHVSFHTWPEEGVITLDLFTCGSASLLPVLADLERLFGVPQQHRNGDGTIQVVEPSFTRWGHKLRGFRTDSEHIKDENIYEGDFGRSFLLLMDMDYKKMVSSNVTKFQRIDVVDALFPSRGNLKQYQRSLSNDGSYESQNPELFAPDRIVYLDGVLQSTRLGDESYHEPLVQPAMFAHNNPKHVAIVGGGECATLREVLKHNTVEKVTMIEIDEEMVQVSRENIPSWSDCSDLQGSEDWCGDDKRADVRYEDALKYFLDKFLDPNTIQDEKLDIFIMDALDPQDNVDFADVLYKNDDFVKAIYNSLNDDGIIVMQLGITPKSNEPPEQFSKQSKRDHLINSLLKIGFQSLHAYEEPHCQFYDPWSFLVGFKDYKSRDNWFRNSALTQIEMQKRLLTTKSGKPTLKYFDGATMKSYQIPHKSFEIVYCRQVPKPKECLLLDENFHLDNVIQRDNLEVKASSISGNGIFTKVDIPEGGVVSLRHMTDLVYLPYSTVQTILSILENCENAKDLNKVYNYMYGYGWTSNAKGSESIYMESSILSYMNHGCDNSYNYGSGVVSTSLKPQFNPFLDRHLYILERGDHALRDIKAGEELLSNYLEPLSVAKKWGGVVEEVNKICAK